MRVHRSSIVEPIACLWRNRGLIYSLTHRDIMSRYQGSILGILWTIFNPLFMLAVYTFVFTVVFQSRWAGGSDSKMEFALLLFAGLIVFSFFAECISRAPMQIMGNSSYVKKVVFPLEILTWVNIGTALFHAAISTIVWLVAYTAFIGIPSWTVILAPIVIVPMIMFVAGLSWLLASIGVYLRDTPQVITIAVTMLMFLSPIFYPASSVPASVQPIFNLNPMVPVIEQMRGVLYWGTGIPLVPFCTYMIAASVIAWLGFAWFQRTRGGFADVL